MCIVSGHRSASPLWLCCDGGWAWVARCLSDVGCRGLASRETWSQGWALLIYTTQSCHRHTHTHTIAVHHPCIQTLCTHGVALWAFMKTGLSAGCGLSYQPLLPWSPQMNPEHECVSVSQKRSLDGVEILFVSVCSDVLDEPSVQCVNLWQRCWRWQWLWLGGHCTHAEASSPTAAWREDRPHHRLRCL